MAKHSAGILLYRRIRSEVEVLLVHPGGPFWAKKDLGSWSIPKGEFEAEEDALAAAKREFEEEIGSPCPEGDYQTLGDYRQPGGKIVHAFLLEADFNLENFRSNVFEMEWPPKSGKKQGFPENDRAAWVLLAAAGDKVVKGQVPIMESLARHLGVKFDAPPSPPDQAALF